MCVCVYELTASVVKEVTTAPEVAPVLSLDGRKNSTIVGGLKKSKNVFLPRVIDFLSRDDLYHSFVSTCSNNLVNKSAASVAKHDSVKLEYGKSRTMKAG